MSLALRERRASAFIEEDEEVREFEALIRILLAVKEFVSKVFDELKEALSLKSFCTRA